jgi:NAD+ diphosphatase
MPTSPLDYSRGITFGYNPLDRRSEEREDGVLLAAALADAQARTYVLSGDRLLIRPGAADPGTHDPAAARDLGIDMATALLLGWLPNGSPRFAARLSVDPDGLFGGYELVDLRTLAQEALIGADSYGPVAQARSMLGWHERHGFCANCGHATTIALGGYRRDCPSCAAQHFPRIDPVAIMLVSLGDRILLGRGTRFRTGNFSCLAGFVEPGETIEDAVRRETFEEAGIRVGRVRYHASQPWPFVSTLMIGCIGEALNEDIVMDATELEACRWFSRAEVSRMVEGTHPDGITCPPRLAIARHLIDHWLQTPSTG